MTRRLLLFCDFSADPLWELPSEVMVDLDSLAIEVVLRARARAWAARWEALALRDMHAEGVERGAVDGPARRVGELEWAENVAEGRLVWQLLRQDLAPDVLVGWVVGDRETGRHVQWDPEGPIEPCTPHTASP